MHGLTHGDKMAAILQTTFSKTYILIWISLKFVPKYQIDNKSTLVQIMAWRQTQQHAIIWANDGLINDAYMYMQYIPHSVNSLRPSGLRQ